MAATQVDESPATQRLASSGETEPPEALLETTAGQEPTVTQIHDGLNALLSQFMNQDVLICSGGRLEPPEQVSSTAELQNHQG